MQDNKITTLNASSVSHWLKKDITVSAPGWVFALAAAVAVILLGVALD